MSVSEPDAIAAAAALLGDLAVRDAPLGARTTYRVGGAAALLVEVTDAEVLAGVARAVAATGVEVVIVGRGSNLLVADEGFAGLAVVLGEAFADVAVDGVTVRAGGAAALPVVARRSVAEGLTGFEWAVGVPGSIGGAVRMNAGGHGSDMAAVLVEVRVIDLATGNDEVVAPVDLDLGYRRSNLRATQLVAAATLGLAPGAVSAGEAQIAEIVRWRRANQPGGPNAGSVFANPPGDSAGRLVEAAGAKGLRIGSAMVSAKHANFIQADEGGRANDVHALMLEVQHRVRAALDVELVPETRLVGFDAQPYPEGWT